MLAPVDPDLVDLARVAAWMDDHELEPGLPIDRIQVLGGGTQNLLVAFRRGHRDLVLRRPPHPKRPRSDQLMLREARVVEALGATEVPHPAFVARCTDVSVIGATFYLMEAVDGCNPTIEVPPQLADVPGRQGDLGRQVVEALLALARVRPDCVGLQDLGRPDGWAERQTARWWRQLESYDTWRGRPDELLPGVGDLRDWMDANPPNAVSVGLVHGDLHLANVLVDRHDGRLTALVDWELATQGDPLLDLGHLLATWPTVTGPAALELATPLPNLPGVDVVIDAYAMGSDRDLDDLPWFRAMACYRLAIILQGGWARSLVGEEPTGVGERARDRSLALIEQALQVVFP